MAPSLRGAGALLLPIHSRAWQRPPRPGRQLATQEGAKAHGVVGLELVLLRCVYSPPVTLIQVRGWKPPCCSSSHLKLRRCGHERRRERAPLALSSFKG
eukprot:352667-Chlamydomonas_euryale.AAC.1